MCAHNWKAFISKPVAVQFIPAEAILIQHNELLQQSQIKRILFTYMCVCYNLRDATRS